MKSISNYQIFPIENDQEFEEFVCDIFNSIEKTNTYQLYGRKGQDQSGIDVFSFEKKTVIQCKHKLISRPDKNIRKELIDDFRKETNSFIRFNTLQENHFKRFIIASTFKNDTVLSDECMTLSRVNGFSVEYWSWKKLTKHVVEELFEKYFPSLRKTLELYYRNTTVVNSQIPVDKDQPILNQLYDFLLVRFRDIKILHTRMFLDENVFENKLNDYSRRNVFTFKTNEVFFGLFEGLEFKDKTLVNNFNENPSQFLMYDFITKTLSDNYIRHIIGKNYNQVKTIINRKQQSEDYFDYFEKFSFIEVLRTLPAPTENSTLDEILRQGYFYYKIGDLLKSKDLFHLVSIKALEENKKISYLIAQHNLLHLAKFIEWRYYRLENKFDILKELKAISINDVEVDDIDLKIKEMIVSRSFFSSAQESIQSYTLKVEELYYSYLRGARNSVNFEDELNYEYSVLHSFLSKNYVVYDEYSDYSQVITNLFNSILASYSIKNGRNRIEYLDDYYLYHFVEYGDKKEFEKYLKRYRVYEIDYKKLEDQDYQFVWLFSNFANNSTAELNILLEQNDEYFIENFKERFNKIFRNFIFFSGILKLETKDISKVTRNIFKVLNNKKITERYNANDIYDFFIRKNKQIKNSYLIQFIFYVLKNKGYYSLNKIVAFFDHLGYDKIILDFSTAQFNSLLKILDQEIEDQENNYHLAVSLYGAVVQEHQQILKVIILEKLNDNFDRDLYVLMLVYDLIDYNFNNYFDLFLESITMSQERPSNRGMCADRDSGSRRYAILDDLFNIIFKYDIDLLEGRFDKFKKISNYYDWLFDIDHFDYTKFDPYWINEYASMFYYDRMKKHEQILRKEVQKHIVKTEDKRLKEIFYNIFCYEE